MLITAVAGGGLGAAVGAALWWRFAARRRSIPCPVWLAGTMETRVWRRMPPSIAELDLRPGLRVLDVGSGPGRVAIPMARAVAPGGEVVALDVQPGMLERLRARMADAGVGNIRPVLADITRAPLQADSFDRAVLVTVLGEIPDRPAALAAIRAALKPGGTLSVTEILPDPHYQRRATVQRLAENAGLRLKRTSDGRLSFTMTFEKQV